MRPALGVSGCLVLKGSLRGQLFGWGHQRAAATSSSTRFSTLGLVDEFDGLCSPSLLGFCRTPAQQHPIARPGTLPEGAPFPRSQPAPFAGHQFTLQQLSRWTPEMDAGDGEMEQEGGR